MTTRIIHHPPTTDALDHLTVELLGTHWAHVTDNGTTLAVTPYYCAHCRDSHDGEGMCEHKRALEEAEVTG